MTPRRPFAARAARHILVVLGALAIGALAACSGAGSDTTGAPTGAVDATSSDVSTAALVERLKITAPFRNATAEQVGCLVDALVEELGEERATAVVETAIQGETSGRAVTAAEAATAGAAFVRCADYRALYTRTYANDGVGLEPYECQAKALDANGFDDIAALEFLPDAAWAKASGTGRELEAEATCADPATLRTGIARAAWWPTTTPEERTCFADRLVADLGPGVAGRVGSLHHRSGAEARAMVAALAACADLQRIAAGLLAERLPAAQATCIADRMTDPERRELALGQLTDDIDPLTDARATELLQACGVRGGA
jgi:hypothetical protein